MSSPEDVTAGLSWPSRTDRRRLLSWAVELAIVMLLVLTGTLTGARYLSDHRVNALGDFLAHASMMACGQALSVPAKWSPAFVAFYARDRPAISCAEVIGDRPSKEPNGFAVSHRNLIYSAAVAMRVGGLSWKTLDWFVGGVFGLSMALVYGLLRMTLWRGLALLAVVAVLCSNHIVQITNLRDFTKELWFLLAWIMIGWLLHRRGERASAGIYLPACAGGAVVGIGLGFRLDLLACIPVFPLVIGLAVPGWGRAALVRKSLAVGVFLVVFALTAFPTLMALGAGSNSGHFAVLGMMRSFTVGLGLEPPVYDIGDIYADEYAHSLITAHAAVVQHDPVTARLLTPDYDRQSFLFLADYAKNFPADIIARSLGATRQVLRYPFTEEARSAYLTEDLFPPGPIRTVAGWRARVFSRLDPFVLLLVVLALSAGYVRDWRVGSTVTLLILYFCGYSMIQFSRRHTFHYDVVAINLVLFAIQAVALALLAQPWSLKLRAASKPNTRQAVVGLACLAALGSLLAVVLVAARLWQQPHLVGLFTRSLDADWRRVDAHLEPIELTPGGVLGPGWYDLYYSPRSPWTQPLAIVQVSLPEPAGGTLNVGSNHWVYLRLDVGGPRCAHGSVPVVLNYTGTFLTSNWEYKRAFTVPVEGPTPSVLLVPVLYRAGASRFGFILPQEQASCVVAVYRAESAEALPLPMIAAVLPPTWRMLPLYQSFSR